jgi:imidazolonepropionase
MTAALGCACLAARLPVDEAIAASTLNASHALGLADRVGSIAPGERADLVVHDVPNRYHLVYRFGVPRVSKVVVGGKLVVPGKSGLRTAEPFP